MSPEIGSGEFEALNEHLVLVFGGRRERLRDFTRQFGKVKRTESRAPRAGLDLADAQQGVEGLEHALDIADRRIDRRPRRAGRRVVPRGFETAQHACQGLAQIVGDVGADLLVRQQELLDAIEQPVEGPRQRIQIVVGSALRNAPAPVAVHQTARGPAHRIDAAQELRAEPQSADRPQRERGRDRPGEGGQHAGQDRVDRRRSSPTRRDDPSASGVMSERTTSGFDFGRLFAIGFLRLDPAARRPRSREGARSPAIKFAVGSHKTVGEARAARSPRVDDFGQPVASAIGKRAL